MQIPLIRAHVALHKDGARKDKLQLQTYSLLKTSFLLAQPTKVLKMATLCLELHELDRKQALNFKRIASVARL
jgi:hypothetical protein